MATQTADFMLLYDNDKHVKQIINDYTAQYYKQRVTRQLVVRFIDTCCSLYGGSPLVAILDCVRNQPSKFNF